MRTGLRIRVLSGSTVDGRREYEFPASAERPEERIVIGRDPIFCQVVFVDELRHEGLGNEHLALRRSLGSYQLDLNTQNVVLLNGRRTFEEKELTGTNVVQLGSAVKLEVTVVDDRSPTIGGERMEQHPEATHRHRMVLSGGIAFVAALAIGGLWYVRTIQQQAAAETLAAVAAFADLAPVSDKVIANVRKSVYAVMLRTPDGGEAIIGTGWAASGGKVVTNVHVVDDQHDEEMAAMVARGAELIVRSALSPHRSHRVTKWKPHPGHQRFLDVMAGMRPLRKSLGGFQPVDFDSACDVAILDVEDADELAAPLTIAPPEVLRTLRSGQSIAMVGYPEEDMVSNDVARPEPASQRASIVRMTDFFMDHRDDGNNQLVQHSLPVAGGASGSPIVNVDGQVVGVITAINTVALSGDDAGGGEPAAGRRRRIMNPAAVNFGQRADLVLDLLEGREEDSTAAYEADWLRSLGRLDRLADQAIPLRQKAWSRMFGRKVSPRVMREFSGKAVQAGIDDELHELPSQLLELPRGLISIVAVPEDSVDIDVALLDRSLPILEATDREVAYHGDIVIPNRFSRRVQFVVWTPSDRQPKPVGYKATVIDWGIDPDEYIRHMAREQGRVAIRTTSAPGRAFDLKSARLDSSVSIDGRDVVAGQVSWTLPRRGMCVATCRPSQPAQVVLMVDGPDGLQPLSPPSETPYAVIPCLTADKPNKLVIIAPFANADDEPVDVDVHIDAWLAR